MKNRTQEYNRKLEEKKKRNGGKGEEEQEEEMDVGMWFEEVDGNGSIESVYSGKGGIREKYLTFLKRYEFLIKPTGSSSSPFPSSFSSSS